MGECLPGGWHLEELIGRGGSATVYRAQREDGALGAAKIMHPRLASDPTWVQRFRREIALLEGMAHPGLVRLLDVGQSEPRCFFVMELLEGQSLERCRTIAGGSLPADVVLRWGDGVLDVLVPLHARGVLHRDIKPSNVFMTTSGVLKLLDFGIAHVEAQGSTDTNARETLAAGVLGTPAYMAPEQARGRWDLVDVRSDLWSVGAMMFTLLSGQPVFLAETENERLGLAMSTPARSLRTALPSVSRQLADVIDRALAYDPRDRWASAQDFQRALASAAGTSDGTEGWTTQHEVPANQPARGKSRIPLAPALALAAGCAFTFLATARPVPHPLARNTRAAVLAAPSRGDPVPAVSVTHLEISSAQPTDPRGRAPARRDVTMALRRAAPVRPHSIAEQLLDERVVATSALSSDALLDRRE